MQTAIHWAIGGTLAPRQIPIKMAAQDNNKSGYTRTYAGRVIHSAYSVLYRINARQHSSVRVESGTPTPLRPSVCASAQRTGTFTMSARSYVSALSTLRTRYCTKKHARPSTKMNASPDQSIIISPNCRKSSGVEHHHTTQRAYPPKRHRLKRLRSSRSRAFQRPPFQRSVSCAVSARCPAARMF